MRTIQSACYLALASWGIAACGGGNASPAGVSAAPTPVPTPAPTPPTFLIVPGGGLLLSYAVRNDGGMMPVSQTAMYGSVAIVAGPEGNSVSSLNTAPPSPCCRSDSPGYSVDDYEVGPTGELYGPSYGGDGPDSAAQVAWSKRFLFTSGNLARGVQVFPRETPYDPFAKPVWVSSKFIPNGVAVSPDGRVLYILSSIPDSTSSTDFAFEGFLIVDAHTGRADPSQEVSLAGELPCCEMTFHPSGRFAYVPALSERLLVFSVDDAGALSLRSSVPVALKGMHVTVHPNGRLLYVTTSGDITTYAIDPGSGALTLRDYQRNDALSEAIGGFSIDPQGRFMYAKSYGNLWGYAIDADGAVRFMGIVASWYTDQKQGVIRPRPVFAVKAPAP